MTFKISNLHSIFFMVTLILAMSSCSISKQEKQPYKANELLGSWKMQSFYWMSTDTTYSRNDVQPGIFLFTDKSYSIQWTPTKKPRIPFEVLSKPTNEEKIAGFQSIVFNAGSYIFTESTITTTAFIAKVPGFEGGKQFYTYKIVDDILSLTMFDEIYPDGTKPEWSGKWKTRFVLQRLD